MHEKWLKIVFFCKFSKTSEKTAYLQKKVCRNPQRSSRCRCDCRKKLKTNRQNFFWFAFRGTICSERRVLQSQWLGKAHVKFDSEMIQKCFTRTGCCLDITGKQNDLVHIDGVKTFQVPKLGDPKNEKVDSGRAFAVQRKRNGARNEDFGKFRVKNKVKVSQCKRATNPKQMFVNQQ